MGQSCQVPLMARRRGTCWCGRGRRCPQGRATRRGETTDGGGKPVLGGSRETAKVAESWVSETGVSATV